MQKYLKNTGLLLVVSVIVFIVLTLLVQFGVFNSYIERIVIIICINIIMALSANLIINITGQLTLGHAAFMAVGAYTSAYITIHLHYPFLIVLILGGFMAALFGFLIGLPTLRLKGDYLAITTLGFNQIIVVAIQNMPFLGGAQGMTGIPAKTNLAWVFFSMVVTLILLFNLVHSRHGRGMVSVREDEISAQAMGINTTYYKILAFTIGAFFAGVAGGLYSHFMMYADPNSFNFLQSINYLIYVVLGGAGSFAGCMVSTAVLTMLQEALRDFGSLDMVIYPVLLIIIMILRVKNPNFTAHLKKLLPGSGVRAQGGK